MSKTECPKKRLISPDMTLLDTVSQYREADAAFKRYDKKAGACIGCEALFDPLRTVAGKYHLDLEKILSDLKAESKQMNV